MTGTRTLVRFGIFGLIASSLAMMLAGAMVRLTYPELAHRIMQENMAMRIRHLFHTAAIAIGLHAGRADAGDGAAGPPIAVNAGPVPPTAVGVNLGGISSFSTQRAFANLAIGGFWLEAGVTDRYSDLAAANQTADGGVSSLRPGATAILPLTFPATGPHGATIGCSWTGQGTVTMSRNAVDLVAKGNSLRFRWTNFGPKTQGVEFRITSVAPQHPIEHVDCRETTTPADAVFDPVFLKELQGFKTIRLMDWQLTNDSVKVSWNSRNRPSSILYGRGDGVPVEPMMTLANQLGADPWFCMSWNADNDYIEHFAQYVHDHLPAGRRVYVENSNEVWNTAFAATRQAMAEGMAEHLSSEAGVAGLYRYAEKTTQVMAIWSRVFADRPHSLVRIAASQQNVSFKSEAVLGFRDTAAHVDALATSAYFGDLMHEGMTDNLDEAFTRLNHRVDQTIGQALENKAVARKFGKAYVTYEAGQAIVIPYNMALVTSVERDPRMYGVYRRFLDEWRGRVGGPLNLFNNVGDIRESGAWGLLEHSGQPLSEAPKMRAVVDDRAAHP